MMALSMVENIQLSFAFQSSRSAEKSQIITKKEKKTRI